MVSSRVQVSLIAAGLIILGLGLCLYKAVNLGFPLFPGEYRDVWTVESKISFRPSRAEAVEVELKLPTMLAGWSNVDEYFASSGFGFTVIAPSKDNGFESRRARWTRQTLERPTTLYYKQQMFRANQAKALPDLPVPEVSPPLLENDRQAAMARLVDRLSQQSSDRESFTGQLLRNFCVSHQIRTVCFCWVPIRKTVWW
jgi:hypothetical protein